MSRPQIAAEKAYRPLHRTVEHYLALASNELAPDTNLCRSAECGHGSLSFAARRLLHDGRFQEQQIWSIGSRAIAFSEDVFELVCLVQFFQEALVDSDLKRISELDLAGLDPLYLDTRLLCRIATSGGGFSWCGLAR